MKKRVVLIFLILFFSTAVLFSAITDIMVSSALGMMRTHYLIPVEGDETYTCLTEDARVIDTDVAAIGICVAEYYGLNRESYGWGSTVTNPEDFVNKVTIDITYDGYFTSDENPSIKRPYEIHMVEKRGRTIGGGTGNYGVYYDRSYKFPSLSEGGDTSKTFPSSSLVNATTDTNGYFWADIILQLPGEASSDRKGVTVGGGVYYPIVEGTYSTEVTITISGMVQDRTTGTERVESQSFKIPLMAEHTLDSPIGYGESQVSMNVSPNAYAGNLNLEDMLATGIPVEVGDLSFMIRQNDKSYHDYYDNNELNEDNCKEKTGVPNYRIFFSASSDPMTQNTNGFLLVHEDYESGIDSYNSRNSIPFYVQVDGTGDTTGRSGLYDGRAYMNDSGEILEGTGSSLPATVIVPKCIYFKYLPPDWVHMHVFEGAISVYVNANPNHMLNAGRYRGDIYVHVVDVD